MLWPRTTKTPKANSRRENQRACGPSIDGDALEEDDMAGSLTRIGRHRAIYFCLHRGSLPENIATGQPRLRDKACGLKIAKKTMCQTKSRLPPTPYVRDGSLFLSRSAKSAFAATHKRYFSMRFFELLPIMALSMSPSISATRRRT